MSENGKEICAYDVAGQALELAVKVHAYDDGPEVLTQNAEVIRKYLVEAGQFEPVQKADSEYDYFTDGDNEGDEWVWRFRKGHQEGELNKAYDRGWIKSYSTRDLVEKSQQKIAELPRWAQ